MKERAHTYGETRAQSVAHAVVQKKTVGESTFQLMDNRPEAITQAKLGAMANNLPQVNQAAQHQTMPDNQSVLQLRLSEEELADYYNEKLYQGKTLEEILEENKDYLDAEEKEQLGIYFSDQDKDRAKAERVQDALASINKSTRMTRWDYDGITYHLNFTTETHHVTEEGNPKKHYFFEGTGTDILPKQCTSQERGRNSKESKFTFASLPGEVQDFVKEHWGDL
ncbi:hypothetical protein [Lewinella sp. W8]|uniref:hypothetical protein n=1 Tax=Lewinella sp. W8 TaxID=2528208 RepID=UPI0010688C64|nr:hypothetical protein [Lewinella sp. W8]MTB52083.1 hypothetical protein [Lewinella sp. W8]